MSYHIDFLGIGAPKAGTTSLFHYLKNHPDIEMPAEKELPFFNKGNDSRHIWNDFYKKNFKTDKSCKGKITPQYMNFPETPAKIAKMFPEIKLIALLRNPVDRAYSYYAMKRRNGSEHRTFEEAVDFQMNASNAEFQSACNSYLRRGKYGEILGYYLDNFSRSQILIIFSDDLKKKPIATVKSIFKFLNVDSDYIPPNIQKRYFVGGDKMRFKSLHKNVSKNSMLKGILNLIPYGVRRKIRHWYFNEFNVIKTKEEMNTTMRTKLVNYFYRDIKFLEDTFSIQTPWQEFKDK